MKKAIARKNAIRMQPAHDGQRLVELENDHDERDQRDHEEAAQRRVHARPEAADHAVVYARTASAAPTRVAPENQASRRRGSFGA